MVMRYGQNIGIKSDTLYFSPEIILPIIEVDQCRYLEVQLKNTGKFDIHINF